MQQNPWHKRLRHFSIFLFILFLFSDSSAALLSQTPESEEDGQHRIFLPIGPTVPVTNETSNQEDIAQERTDSPGTGSTDIGSTEPDHVAQHLSDDLVGIPMEQLEADADPNAGLIPTELAETVRAASPNVDGQWSQVYPAAVVPVFTTLLPNGDVLMWDSVGDAPTENYTNHTFTRAAVWSPSTNSSVRVDVSGSNIFCAGYTHLSDGRIFVAGGNKNSALDGIKLTHIFDPNTNSWTRGPDMEYERWYPSVAALPNEELFIMGGGPNFHEVYQTNNSLRTLTSASLSYTREYPFIQAAPDGRVLYAGQYQTMRMLNTSNNGSWQSYGNRDSLNRSYGSYAMYDVGKVLVAGGAIPARASARVIDVLDGSPSASSTGSMTHARRQHNLTILPDGTVLATGGLYGSAGLVDLARGVYAAEVWNPDNGQWTELASMSVTRQYHSTALLLADGRVLVGGGGICGACQSAGYLRKDFQIFSPPYLFNSSGGLASRPTISSVSSAIGFGQDFTINSPEASSIAKVALVRLGAPTHGQDMGQRYVPLTFSSNGNILTASPPANANSAPPGYYMLFLIDNSGVPSVAEFVVLSTPPPQPGSIRYVRLVADSEVNGNPWTSAAEFNVLDSNGTPLPRNGWTVTADSEETAGEDGRAVNAIDGNVNTIWHTQWQSASPPHPHEIIVDMGTGYTISGFRYLPRQTGTVNGTIADYRFYVSADGVNWGSPVAQGTFANDTTEKSVTFVFNQPPTIINPGAQSNTEGESVNLAISASDPENNPLTFGATGLPNGLNITTNSGVIAGTVNIPGTFNVTVTVDDGNGGIDSASFTWTVDEQIISGSTISIDAQGSAGSEVMELLIDGQTVQSWIMTTNSQTYSYIHNSTVSADQIRIEFTNNGRDPVTNADRNLTVDKISVDSTVYETEAPTVEGKGVWDGGSCQVVAYHQSERLSCNGYFQYNSGAINLPPTLQNPGSQVSTIGNALTLILGASDPNGDTLTFDATGLPTGLSVNNSSGQISGTPTELGTSNVVATVSDGNGGSDSASFTWIINDGSTSNCGGLIQEAEEAQLSGGFVIVNSGAASGGQYIHVPNGSGNQWNGPSTDRADFCFDVTTAGTYRLLGTIQSTGGGNNSFYVTIDGQPTDGYLWDTTIAGSSFVDDYVSQRGGADPIEFNLTAGEHTIAIYLREDGTVLDKLELELVSSDPPIGSCDGLEREAEEGILRGSMVIGSDGNASGGQYIHLPNGTGNNFNGASGPDQAEYCFTVPTAGTYLLEGTVLATSGGNNSFYATVDGQPATGYLWDTIIDPAYIQDFLSDRGGADPVQLNLSAGEHTVIIYPREDGTRLDKLVLADEVISAAQITQLGGTERNSLAQNNSGIYGTLYVPDSVENEPAIAGLTVLIRDRASGELAAQTTTSQVGKYYIDGLNPGNYQVQLTVELADGSEQQLTQSIHIDAGQFTDGSFDYPYTIDDPDGASSEDNISTQYLFVPFISQ